MTEPSLATLLNEPVVRKLGEAAGDVACHLVGGVVRDRLTGRATPDFDASVASGAEAIARRLERSLPARLVHLGGERFAALRLVGEGFQLDLWDRCGGTLLADLERRDFTINSIAVALDGEVSDPLGGREDVAHRRLRANRRTSFDEDPLRVVRLVRFAAYGYRVTAPTAAGAREAASRLSEVAPERVREELRAALTAPQGRAAVHWLAATGLFPALWDPSEAAPRPPARSALQNLDRAAGKLERRLQRLGASPVECSLARQALLTALPVGERLEPAERLRALASRGLISRREQSEIARLTAAGARPRTTVEQRRWLHAQGPSWPLAVAVRAALAPPAQRRAWDRLAPRLLRLADREPGLFDPQPLLDGHEIQRLTGLAPGAELGRYVAELKEAQVEGRVKTRQEAEELLRLKRSSGAG